MSRTIQEPPQDQDCGGFVYGTAVARGLDAGVPQQALGLLAGEGLVDLVDGQGGLAAKGADEASNVRGLGGFLTARADGDADDYGVGPTLAGRVEDGADVGGQPGAVNYASGQGGADVIGA